MSAPFDPPQSFLDTLASEHGGRLRVRWSDKEQQWHIEQKMGRTRMPKASVSVLDDKAIRLRDGYEFLLAVTPGTQTRCPRCAKWVKVPVLEMRYAKCGECHKEFRACYYPLGDALLEWLRYSSPDRGGLERVFRDADRAAEAKEFWDTRRQRGRRQDAIWDDWRQLFGIQSVGYTGKEFRG